MAGLGLAAEPQNRTFLLCRKVGHSYFAPTHDACYKPFAIFDGKKWLLWYNGRHGAPEQIGLVIHDGEDLGFAAART